MKKRLDNSMPGIFDKVAEYLKKKQQEKDLDNSCNNIHGQNHGHYVHEK